MVKSRHDENEDLAQVIGRNAAQLALVEVSLGSVVHGFNIPLGGTLLSLNQGYFLTRMSLEIKNHEKRGTLPFSVSCIVALLKSLSPAGNKLAPMLSISMQGLLFSIPLMIFRVSTMTLLFSSWLLALWSFCQPFLSYYILFGQDLFLALEALAQKALPVQVSLETLLPALLALVFLKLCVATLLVGFAVSGKKISLLESAQGRVGLGALKKPQAAKAREPWVQAVGDMTRPLFLFSFLLTGIFLITSGVEQSQMVWKLLRPLALAFLFFYISRTFLISRLFKKLQGTRLEFLNRAHEVALDRLGELAKRSL